MGIRWIWAHRRMLASLMPLGQVGQGAPMEYVPLEQPVTIDRFVHSAGVPGSEREQQPRQFQTRLVGSIE